MTEINQLLSHFDQGARANRFNVAITNIPFTGIDMPEGHNFRCISATLPGIALGTNTEDTGWSGSREIPDGTIDYGDSITLEFICTSSFLDRIIFEQWQQKIYEGKPIQSAKEASFTADNRAGQNRGTLRQPVMRYYNEYAGGMMIEQLRISGSPAMRYEFFNAYPLSYAEMSLDADSQEPLLKFSVDMAYSDFVISYPENTDEPRVIEPMTNDASSSSGINTGRGLLDATLDTLKVASRFSPKAGEYLTKLSSADTQITRAGNIGRTIRGLGIGGDG